MDKKNLIQQAVEKAGGPSIVARACGLATYQAVRKWEKAGHLPRTEWTGETRYSEVLEQLTGGEFSRAVLLSTRSS